MFYQPALYVFHWSYTEMQLLGLVIYSQEELAINFKKITGYIWKVNCGDPHPPQGYLKKQASYSSHSLQI